jgi:hypothetical protein
MINSSDRRPGDHDGGPDRGQTAEQEAEQAAELVQISAELSRKHPDVPADRVRELVNRSAVSLRQRARVTDFIPVLVINQVSTQLRHTAV